MNRRYDRDPTYQNNQLRWYTISNRQFMSAGRPGEKSSGADLILWLLSIALRLWVRREMSGSDRPDAARKYALRLPNKYDDSVQMLKLAWNGCGRAVRSWTRCEIVRIHYHRRCGTCTVYTLSTAPDAAPKGQLFSGQDTTRSIVLARTHLSPTTRIVLEYLQIRVCQYKKCRFANWKAVLNLNDAQ